MSDYLWDKTGEPDEEVERLEKLLGGLAHQPRALELPRDARVEQTPRRSWSRPAFAAAAALALMLLAGAWLLASRVKEDEAQTAQDSQATAPRIEERARDDKNAAAREVNNEAAARDDKKEAGARDDKNDVHAFGPKKNEGPAERESVEHASHQQQTGRRLLAEQRRRHGSLYANAGSGVKSRGGASRATRPREDLLASVTQRQQQSAKEQLLYALRLTGAKLSEVQTKVRGAGEARPATEEQNKIR